MENDVSDAAALRQSLTEPSRFAVIYDRHLQPVHAYLGRRVGDQSADDLTAEVFVRAFRSRASYGVQYDSALPWLLGIASHLIGDHRRAERRRLKALERLAGDGDALGDVAESRDTSPGLVRALRQLRHADRDALLLVVWGELSYEEAAGALDVPIGTIRSRIARARQQLSGNAEVAAYAQTSATVFRGEDHG